MVSCMIILLVILTAVYIAIAVGLIVNFDDLKREVERKCSYQADAGTVSVAKCDIIDCVRESNLKVLNKMYSNHKELLTEIACLATKNNADIQRVREGYKPGDVIKYDGRNAMVLKLRTKSISDLGQTKECYCVYYMNNGDLYEEDREKIDKNSKFLWHIDLQLEEPVL